MPIREPVSQFTLRVPAAARTQLDQMCLLCGATRRAMFEAIVTIAFEDEQNPKWAAELGRLWEAARALEESGALRAKPRETFIVHMDVDLAARFREACRRRGVSQSAALALSIMPRPEKEGESYQRYRDDVAPRLIGLARLIDYRRRNRSASPPPPPDHPDF